MRERSNAFKRIHCMLAVGCQERSTVKNQPAAKKFSLSWAEGLAHLKNSTTSVELQHAAREWRD